MLDIDLGTSPCGSVRALLEVVDRTVLVSVVFRNRAVYIDTGGGRLLMAFGDKREGLRTSTVDKGYTTGRDSWDRGTEGAKKRTSRYEHAGVLHDVRV